jgi:DNA-3-methyladenine glycosylase
MIVETEAYLGKIDKACHTYNSKKTKRNEVMYQEAGIIYIYLCYGMHHLLNFVTGPKDYPNAVLIRAIEPVTGIDIMMERRNLKNPGPEISNGPGKLTKALGIHNSMNKSIIGDYIHLENNITVSSRHIIESPRVGVSYAEECADWPLRFRIRNNKYAGK